MFRPRRSTARACLALVLALVYAAPGAWIHAREDDDPFCQPTIVAHDPAAHRVGGPSGLPGPPDHCAICHWLQASRLPRQSGGHLSARTDDGSHVWARSSGALLPTHASTPSGRSPPQ